MTLLITVFIFLLLIYLLNKENFKGGSKSKKNWDKLIKKCHKFPWNQTIQCENAIYIDRQKFYSEAECLWCPIFEKIIPIDNMTQMLHNVPFRLYNSNRRGKGVDNVGNTFNKHSEKYKKKKNNSLAVFLLKGVDNLEYTLNKIAKPIKKSKAFQQL